VLKTTGIEGAVGGAVEVDVAIPEISEMYNESLFALWGKLFCCRSEYRTRDETLAGKDSRDFSDAYDHVMRIYCASDHATSAQFPHLLVVKYQQA